MPINFLEVQNYRSIRDVYLRLGKLNVIVGPNGTGKSNLYRSMYLIACAANGTFARTLAEEGGMSSVLWAGKYRKTDKYRFRMEVGLDDLSYEIECGRMPISERPNELGCFSNDPDIKLEEVKFTAKGKSVVMLRRERGYMMARDTDGRRVEYPLTVMESESVLSGLREPHKFPELSCLRQEFLNWRFYHHFRTDAQSPIRFPQIGVITPVLSHDGNDLAAALATVQAMGKPGTLDEALEDAFPGASLSVHSVSGLFSLTLKMPGFNRPFDAVELSDGTLQYLCLLAALLSPRSPALMALNEPETSIHPDLFDPLARLIVRASRKSQLWVTTHARELVKCISHHCEANIIELEKSEDGETRLASKDREIEEDEQDDEADTNDE
jgi:predicted ATPase